MSEMNEIMRENDNFCQHHRKFDVGVTTERVTIDRWECWWVRRWGWGESKPSSEHRYDNFFLDCLLYVAIAHSESTANQNFIFMLLPRHAAVSWLDAGSK